MRPGGCCLGRLVQLALLMLAAMIALPYLLGWLSGESSTEGQDSAPAATSDPWPTDLAGGAPTRSATVGSTPAGSGTSASTSPSAMPTSYPPVTITGRECARTGTGPYAAVAAGNSRTSCAFAQAVQTAYLAGDNLGSATVVTAHSQARNADVSMRCGTGQPVRCDSGDGATVYLYGGRAVIG